ncbi:MucB/RseB C-terminal domain-containing protein [Pseudomonas typographi]|uniref:RNA polymerase subunit sigma n=1 Tax=Pseudomonas typographi TaxID=2715964 RepID=A0ABR7YWC8_9PSED|nr:MucB/RseB C-terminal domain-containing protein [Pseudomonas typographi]MBD1552493.1 RNA polymerase subunit sigma [Pseudomonas typographi]MBD1585583.1 RNA polymerase subunit sigma [Pseudomonas typographi]MBD1597502.1 RNA polymerase subunit sigma [Pseudomonas typographi]
MRALPLLSLLIGSCLAMKVQAAPDAAQWLDRLSGAEHTQSFQGTFVYERSGSFSTHDIWHLADHGKVTERVLQLDGSAQEVLRSAGVTQCVSGSLVPGVNAVPGSSHREFDPLKLMSWYDLKVAGRSRVAGRPAVIVTLTPKDSNRYGFELHLDEQTALPLKSLLLTERGQLLERFQYTRFNTREPSAEDLAASRNCKPVVAEARPAAAEQAPQPLAALGWRSDWLPAGFELVESQVGKAADNGVPLTRLMYDDGLTRFSVFFEPLQGAQASDARTQLGPTSAVSRRQSTADGDVMVTVVGEVPLGTAERVALSMHPLPAQPRQ